MNFIYTFGSVSFLWWPQTVNLPFEIVSGSPAFTGKAESGVFITDNLILLLDVRLSLKPIHKTLKSQQ